jgi:hypothetical protein
MAKCNYRSCLGDADESGVCEKHHKEYDAGKLDIGKFMDPPRPSGDVPKASRPRRTAPPAPAAIPEAVAVLSGGAAVTVPIVLELRIRLVQEKEA